MSLGSVQISNSLSQEYRVVWDDLARLKCVVVARYSSSELGQSGDGS
jgi:hypothetical protein